MYVPVHKVTPPRARHIGKRTGRVQGRGSRARRRVERRRARGEVSEHRQAFPLTNAGVQSPQLWTRETAGAWRAAPSGAGRTYTVYVNGCIWFCSISVSDRTYLFLEKRDGRRVGGDVLTGNVRIVRATQQIHCSSSPSTRRVEPSLLMEVNDDA